MYWETIIENAEKSAYKIRLSHSSFSLAEGSLKLTSTVSWKNGTNLTDQIFPQSFKSCKYSYIIRSFFVYDIVFLILWIINLVFKKKSHIWTWEKHLMDNSWLLHFSREHNLKFIILIKCKRIWVFATNSYFWFL